jgi:uncharacterized protein YjiS (DUF1127 family)
MLLSHQGSALAAAAPWPAAAAAPARARTLPLFAAILDTLRQWRERSRERRELSQLTARDFGDLAVPPSLLANETGRWPWQKPSLGWGAVCDRRQD